MLASKTKIVPVEVKSSGIGKHESIMEFQKKYSKYVVKEILLSQKDIGDVCFRIALTPVHKASGYNEEYIL